MPLKYSQEVREDIATRISGGMQPKQIAETLNISLKTIYRLKKSFIHDGDLYVAPPMTRTVREKSSKQVTGIEIAIFQFQPPVLRIPGVHMY
jgi:transposase